MDLLVTERRKKIWDNFQYGNEELYFPDNKIEFKEQFDSIASRINEIIKYVEMNGGAYPDENCKRQSYIKRLMYQLGSHCIEYKLTKVLYKIVKARLADKGLHLRRKKNSKQSSNVFYLCYRGVFIDEKIISSTEKSRGSRQLEFAHNDQVPTWLIIGYIHQTSGTKAVITDKKTKYKKRLLAEREKLRNRHKL